MANKLLVVVDYQKDFVDGALGFEAAAAIEDKLCDKINAYLRSGDEVVFTLDTHEQKYLFTNEGKHLPVKHCIKGSVGWQLFGKVARLAEGRKCFEKPTFPSLELAKYIEGKGFKQIELAGVVTNICVISNAIMAKAAAPDCQIVVDSACVASNDGQMEQKCFELMKNLHIEVT